MKYICLGYLDENLFNSFSEKEQKNFIDQCMMYDAELRKNRNFIGGEALQSIRTATTIRYKNGKPFITDGPFAETKEQLGGIMILEARDLNHAIQLMSNHPSTRMGGTWEIRPSNEEINALYQEKEKYSMSSKQKE
ncbi:MAG: YciI family protein [Bacteroidetes bacterium]|nr:YciI family protein [Bacteroidota bacterium]